MKKMSNDLHHFGQRPGSDNSEMLDRDNPKIFMMDSINGTPTPTPQSSVLRETSIVYLAAQVMWNA